MMRVDFAVGAADRIRQASQTVLRQFLAGQSVVVYCSNARRLRAFDEQLWSVDDAAFVPHVMASDPLAAVTPVIMVAQDLESVLKQRSGPVWLLNLDDHCPPCLERVDRVLEIVSGDEDDKAMARARWKAYQAAGHEVRSHTLGAKKS